MEGRVLHVHIDQLQLLIRPKSSLHQLSSQRRIVRELATAVDFLHREMDICQRDIKTSNILLMRKPTDKALMSSSPLIKLADFGLAHKSEDPNMLAVRSRLTFHRIAVPLPIIHLKSPKLF